MSVTLSQRYHEAVDKELSDMSPKKETDRVVESQVALSDHESPLVLSDQRKDEPIEEIPLRKSMGTGISKETNYQTKSTSFVPTTTANKLVNSSEPHLKEQIMQIYREMTGDIVAQKNRETGNMALVDSIYGQRLVPKLRNDGSLNMIQSENRDTT